LDDFRVGKMYARTSFLHNYYEHYDPMTARM